MVKIGGNVFSKEAVPVKVTELAVHPKTKGPRVDLGGLAEPSMRASELLKATAARAKKCYRLEWKGSKVPRGATVDGRVIAWTQHGVVRAEDGSEIGTYERLVEFGGEDGNEQKMVVYVN